MRELRRSLIFPRKDWIWRRRRRGRQWGRGRETLRGCESLVTAHPAPAFSAQAALLTCAVESGHTGSGEFGNRTASALKLPGCDGREAKERYPWSLGSTALICKGWRRGGRLGGSQQSAPCKSAVLKPDSRSKRQTRKGRF